MNIPNFYKINYGGNRLLPLIQSQYEIPFGIYGVLNNRTDINKAVSEEAPLETIGFLKEKQAQNIAKMTSIAYSAAKSIGVNLLPGKLATAHSKRCNYFKGKITSFLSKPLTYLQTFLQSIYITRDKDPC